ncbi:MAG: L-methionine (R)-S-oxide reductase [Chthoniobacter sp.]|jgi:GAF domain-containing protein|nr:L-methionine (R)-S-oxide reductase [Chthoniobacter sp.]
MNSPTLPSSIENALATADPAEVLAETIRHFGCQAGTIHLLRDGRLRIVAHQGIPPQVIQIVETVPIGKGIAGLAAERREPVTICNLQTDNSGQARPGARATGMEGSLAVPMLVADELRGVLGIAKAASYDWAPDEQALVLEIARRLGEQAAS